jgi:hypothetical protein
MHYIARAAQVRYSRTSQTTLGGLVAPPALIGDDLVVVVAVNSQDGSAFRSEYEVVRVSTPGTVLTAFPSAIDAQATWGDVITPVRVGPDGALYALVSALSVGARIVGYPLATTAAAPAARSEAGTATVGTPAVAATIDRLRCTPSCRSPTPTIWLVSTT